MGCVSHCAPLQRPSPRREGGGGFAKNGAADVWNAHSSGSHGTPRSSRCTTGRRMWTRPSKTSHGTACDAPHGPVHAVRLAACSDAHGPCGSRQSPPPPGPRLRLREGPIGCRCVGGGGGQNAATRRNMRREERVTVQHPVKEQQPDGMSHGGGGGAPRGIPRWTCTRRGSARRSLRNQIFFC